MADVNRYLKLLGEMRANEAIADGLAAKVVKAGGAMKDWRRVMVSNSGLPFPPEMVLVHGVPTIDVREWPTAEILGKALSDYHASRMAAEGEFNTLPADVRSSLKPPR